MTTVNVSLEVPSGICVYELGHTEPCYSTTIIGIINQWLDSISSGYTIDKNYETDAYTLISELRMAITLVSQALPE
jgi:hypothetical protein